MSAASSLFLDIIGGVVGGFIAYIVIIILSYIFGED